MVNDIDTSTAPYYWFVILIGSWLYTDRLFFIAN